MRTRHIPLGLSLVALLMSATPALGAGPPTQVREFGHKQVTTVYFPDDICGPRAGWTTFVETWRLHVVEFDDSIHLAAPETGWYHTDFDDPAIEDVDAKWTETVSFQLTRGGTVVFNEQLHDFLGDVRIHSHVVFVEVDGSVKVEREIFRVEGCP